MSKSIIEYEILQKEEDLKKLHDNIAKIDERDGENICKIKNKIIDLEKQLREHKNEENDLYKSLDNEQEEKQICSLYKLWITIEEITLKELCYDWIKIKQYHQAKIDKLHPIITNYQNLLIERLPDQSCQPGLVPGPGQARPGQSC
ncbi:unnamed protein product [Rotaria magnacalcarata]|uniref:Uncharacterized protein n=1 Tax=Rotaria magnacalcarata TaxID=392030 RepID=A0A8S2TBP5_9BILA|nr:unnamed protein product [Rotaria magnacalcarata]CAF4274347.1 unnamed protein product [Rotaria magnacalcarata]